MKRRFVEIGIVVFFIAMMAVFFFTCELLLSVSGQKTIVQRIKEEMNQSKYVFGDESVTDNNASDDDNEALNKKQKSSDYFSFADMDGIEFSLVDDESWLTAITVYADGSFKGISKHFDKDDASILYPNGVMDYSEFSGELSDPVSENGEIWFCIVKSLNVNYALDTSEVNEGILYRYCEPYGIIVGSQILISFSSGKSSVSMELK